MPASKTTHASENRFQSLSPASLSSTEKSSVVKLALAVLSARYRPGRAMTRPEDMQALMRLKLNGRRNEVFGAVFLDTRHRVLRIAELFQGTVDGRPSTPAWSCRGLWRRMPPPSFSFTTTLYVENMLSTYQ